jgi:hypothetical protein
VRDGTKILSATIYSFPIHQFSPPWQVQHGGDGRAQGRGAGKEEQVCGAMAAGPNLQCGSNGVIAVAAMA